jgi:hypothetical protein
VACCLSSAVPSLRQNQQLQGQNLFRFLRYAAKISLICGKNIAALLRALLPHFGGFANAQEWFWTKGDILGILPPKQ